MAVEMRLYRVPIIGSNAERRHGKVVDEVTVKVGTKWLTDNRDCRYYKAPSEDANRNPYFQQNSMYWGTDYRLYQTEQAAKDYHRLRLQRPVDRVGEGHGHSQGRRVPEMSTKIFDAWRINSIDIGELVKLGSEIREVQQKSFVDAVYNSLDFCQLAIIFAKKSVEDIEELRPVFASIAANVVHKCVLMYDWTPSFTMTDSAKSSAEQILQKEAQKRKISLTVEQKRNLLDVITEIYEIVSRDWQASLLFLRGDNGSTYMKGFNLTREAAHFIDSQYPRFEYTDQTEMNISDFNEYTRQYIGAAKTEEERYERLLEAQHERGELWDKAFAGHSVWRDAGLSISLVPAQLQEQFVAIHSICKKVFGAEA